MRAISKLLRRIARLGCCVLLLILGLVTYWVWGQAKAARLPISSSFHPFRSAELRDEFHERYDRLAARWPVPSSTRTIETTFGPTFVRITGKDDSPPLVLLHGIGGNAFQWTDNVEALSERFQVFAVDNIYDFGRSVYTRPIERTEDYLLWIDELLEKIEKHRPIHLAGMSYGGWLAARYALMRPERLESLVLIAPAATVRPLDAEWLIRAVFCAIPLRAPTESFMTWLAGDLAASEEGRERISALVDDAYFSMQAFKPRRTVPPNVLSDEELSGLEPPTLFLIGENEKIYETPEVLERLKDVAPAIKTVRIAQAGHDLSIVQAESVNREIVEFLVGIESTRSP
jgi:pimeloyl-ACP methyl ester carboxylesterase